LDEMAVFAPGIFWLRKSCLIAADKSFMVGIWLLTARLNPAPNKYTGAILNLSLGSGPV
jgi:hypothetical protein